MQSAVVPLVPDVPDVPDVPELPDEPPSAPPLDELRCGNGVGDSSLPELLHPSASAKPETPNTAASASVLVNVHLLDNGAIARPKTP